MYCAVTGGRGYSADLTGNSFEGKARELRNTSLIHKILGMKIHTVNFEDSQSNETSSDSEVNSEAFRIWWPY